MIIIKDKLSLIYKIIIVIVIGIGLYLNIQILTFPKSLIYYTIQSNILCFIFFLVVVILTLMKKLKKNNIYYILKGMCTMAITITMIIYQVVISNSYGAEVYANHPFICNLVHLIIPMLVIIDYLVFGEKGNLKKSYSFIWSSTLVIYAIFNIIYINLGGEFINGTNYPYSYMNVDKYGLLRVAINCFGIYTFFILYGIFVQILDSKVAKLTKTKTIK